jgi:glycosyltransferase involved in cell wall biosynthesis
LLVRREPAKGFRKEGAIVMALVRDEIMRLPYFIQYYRELGCAGFIFFDDGSTDGSNQFMLDQSDVMLIEVQGLSYSRAYGIDWINAVVNRIALGRWVLKVDLDELLYWPGSEQSGMDGLIRSTEARGATSVFSPMIDLYGDVAADDAIPYQPGTPFLDFCCWADPIDSYFYQWKKYEQGERLYFYGGPRKRLGPPGKLGPIMSKLPLLYVEKDGPRFLGSHSLSRGTPCPVVAPLLHFKFLADYRDRLDKLIRENKTTFNMDEHTDARDGGISGIPFKFEGSVQIYSSLDLEPYVRAVTAVIEAGASEFGTVKKVGDIPVN